MKDFYHQGKVLWTDNGNNLMFVERWQSGGVQKTNPFWICMNVARVSEIITSTVNFNYHNSHSVNHRHTGMVKNYMRADFLVRQFVLLCPCSQRDVEVQDIPKSPSVYIKSLWECVDLERALPTCCKSSSSRNHSVKIPLTNPMASILPEWKNFRKTS